ncbi:MAG TPA: hypothetical protein VIF60_13830 [Burkholderiaceae bacterium]
MPPCILNSAKAWEVIQIAIYQGDETGFVIFHIFVKVIGQLVKRIVLLGQFLEFAIFICAHCVYQLGSLVAVGGNLFIRKKRGDISENNFSSPLLRQIGTFTITNSLILTLIGNCSVA